MCHNIASFHSTIWIEPSLDFWWKKSGGVTWDASYRLICRLCSKNTLGCKKNGRRNIRSNLKKTSIVVLAVESKDPEGELYCPAMYYPAICWGRHPWAPERSGKEPSVRGKWLHGAQGQLEAYSFCERVFWHENHRVAFPSSVTSQSAVCAVKKKMCSFQLSLLCGQNIIIIITALFHD